MALRSVVALALLLSSSAALKLGAAPKTVSTTRRSIFGLATWTVAAPAFAASSEELKGMLGNLETDLSDAGLAKARKVSPSPPKTGGGGGGTGSSGISMPSLPSIEMPSIELPSLPEATPRDPGTGMFENFAVPDIGAGARAAGKARADAIRAQSQANADETREAPADSAELENSEVMLQLRQKRDAQRAAAEASAEQRKFNRLTPVEQRKAKN